MSNTTYRKTPGRVADDSEANVVEEDDDAPIGLFSTPARTVTVIASLALVVALFAGLLWLVSSRTSTPAFVADPGGVAGKVSVVTKANVGGGQPRRGDKAPDFEWTDAATGQAMRISTLGKPVFINFWGTWCPPCRAEMPEMERLYKNYKGQMDFIGISMGERDSADGVQSFITVPPNGPPSFPYTWRFVHDSNYEVASRYQVTAVPSSYFIGADGVIRAVHIGGMNGQQMEAYLQQVTQPGQ